MSGLFKTKVNLDFIVNPYYLYCIAFSFSIFVYLLGWSKIFPQLSASLILFFVLSFMMFFLFGYLLGRKELNLFGNNINQKKLNDIIFFVIIVLGFTDVLFMGYLPILNRSHNYREFGVPVIDPVFNSLSIFFSVFLFQSFLENRKKRFLVYVFILLIIQIFLFRRSTIIWIVTSSSFLFLLFKRTISLLFIIICILCIPVFSYLFSTYGNFRSSLTRSIVINDLGASKAFKNSGINYTHYMTYLYISSPLANLQKNIDEGDGFFNRKDFRAFFFYSLIPESFTIRLEKHLNLSRPVCSLITPELIVGSLFMISFCTLGWSGMISMFLFLYLFISLCLLLIKKWNTFSATTFAILSTAVSLSIFSNFLNRLDVILMLFIYPVLFHLIYSGSRSNPDAG